MRRSIRSTVFRLTMLVIAAGFAVAPQALASDPVLLASGEQWKLYERRDGDRHCLVYRARGRTTAAPDRVATFRNRHCARVPLPARRLDPTAALAFCTTAPGAMFLSAGPAVAKINVSRLGRKPFALRRYRLRHAAGHAFVLRRELSHRRGTLTSYDAAGNRLAQVSWEPFPAPACAGPPAQAIPG